MILAFHQNGGIWFRKCSGICKPPIRETQMKIGGVILWAIKKLMSRVCIVQSIYTIAMQKPKKKKTTEGIKSIKTTWKA